MDPDATQSHKELLTLYRALGDTIAEQEQRNKRIDANVALLSNLNSALINTIVGYGADVSVQQRLLLAEYANDREANCRILDNMSMIKKGVRSAAKVIEDSYNKPDDSTPEAVAVVAETEGNGETKDASGHGETDA